MAARHKKAEPKFLAGWKDISTYLGKGVRTVQRYEREMGLPIRRPAGKSRAAVVATKAELDAWVEASPYRDTLTLPRFVSNHQTVTASIKRGINEMHRLRDQMFDLRGEVKRTVSILQTCIEQVHSGVNDTWSKRKTYSAEGFESRENPRLGLMRPRGNEGVN
jgi:hypothetical protein